MAARCRHIPTGLKASDDWANESTLDTIWLDGNEAVYNVSEFLLVYFSLLCVLPLFEKGGKLHNGISGNNLRLLVGHFEGFI